jgi:hypothetical protein
MFLRGFLYKLGHLNRHKNMNDLQQFPSTRIGQILNTGGTPFISNFTSPGFVICVYMEKLAATTQRGP